MENFKISTNTYGVLIVPTGPVTVPFVMSIGVGFSKAVGAPEGFGMLTVMSVAPIISVLITSMARKPVKRAASELARISKLSLAKMSKLSMRWVMMCIAVFLAVLLMYADRVCARSRICKHRVVPCCICTVSWTKGHVGVILTTHQDVQGKSVSNSDITEHWTPHKCVQCSTSPYLLSPVCCRHSSAASGSDRGDSVIDFAAELAKDPNWTPGNGHSNSAKDIGRPSR